MPLLQLEHSLKECAKTEILVQECVKTEMPQEPNEFNGLPTPDGDWQAVEGVLSKGGRLDRELNAKHEQKVNHNNEALYFCSESNYLGVNVGQIAHVSSTARVTSQKS